MAASADFLYNDRKSYRKEETAMKGKTIITVAIVLCVLGCVVGGIWYWQGYEAVYYTKIDNTDVKELPASSDMKYEYTLDCYNKDGQKRSLKFKTSRILKENAYLSLEVRSLGVHKWEEVMYNDLPQKVQDRID